MSRAVNSISTPWYSVDETFGGLRTNAEHKINVQREAVPLVFVPGIMGTRMRVKGSDGSGEDQDGLPNLRWDPSSMRSIWWHFSGASGSRRRMLLVGPGTHYSSNFLEVHHDGDVGNGFSAVASGSYHDFLAFLQKDGTWGPLTKLFEFPVYAVGYNWSDTNKNSGKALAARIDEIIDEARQVTGACTRVIIITHSMGGLVSRAASEIHGAQSKILGIIHGVQPAAGAAAVYWRVKAGIEWAGASGGVASRVLGNSASTTVPVLGSMPGALELLPNLDYTDNRGNKAWLQVKEDQQVLISLPRSDPYDEIYRVKGTGDERKHLDRKVWGLIDPDLLDDALPARDPADASDPETLAALGAFDAWTSYLAQLRKAESLQQAIRGKLHPITFTFHGTGHKATDRVDMKVDTPFVERESYPKRSFRGYFKNAQGDDRRATIQAPSGSGDGTVPLASAKSLDHLAQSVPAPVGFKAEHEPVFDKEKAARDFVVRSVSALCKRLYESRRG